MLLYMPGCKEMIYYYYYYISIVCVGITPLYKNDNDINKEIVGIYISFGSY